MIIFACANSSVSEAVFSCLKASLLGEKKFQLLKVFEINCRNQFKGNIFVLCCQFQGSDKNAENGEDEQDENEQNNENSENEESSGKEEQSDTEQKVFFIQCFYLQLLTNNKICQKIILKIILRTKKNHPQKTFHQWICLAKMCHQRMMMMSR